MGRYCPIGSAKGVDIKTGETIYGFHWQEVPYECFSPEQKIKHFIREQENRDWGLTKQIDHEVYSDSVGYYIGKLDIEGTPLFTNDLIEYYSPSGALLRGYIQYDTTRSCYVIMTDNNVFAINVIKDIKYLSNRFEVSNKDRDVILRFKEKLLDRINIENGIKNHYEIFGEYPRKIEINKEQFFNLVKEEKDVKKFIDEISMKYNIMSFLVKGE